MKFSTYTSKTDNKPKAKDGEWDKVAAFLTKHRELPDKDGPLWSPASYTNGSRRCNDGVDELSALVLDFDGGKSYEDVCGAWRGLEHVVYSTYSHTLDHPKWRAVFPFAEPVPRSAWGTVYPTLATLLGGEHIDDSCKDASRMYYVPACPADSEPFALRVSGRMVCKTDWENAEPDGSKYVSKVPERTQPFFRRPGDEFASRTPWEQILEPKGWRFCKVSGDRTYWTRPGKTEGISASTGNGLTDLLWVHTSNALPLRAQTSYSKFGAYTELYHGGDYHVAAESLKENASPRSTLNYVEPETPTHKWANLSTVQPTQVEWLWRPYLPVGVVTLVYGDSGIGKSTAMLALISHLTNGTAPPNGIAGPPVNCIVLSAEDPADMVIVPRLQCLDADLTRIVAPLEHDSEGRANPLRLDLDGISELTKHIVEFDAKLVVIDPLRAYFAAMADMNSQTDARAFMRALTGLAHDCRCAIALIHHVNKGIGNNTRYRASGSQDFMDACRSAMYVMQDPDDESNCAIDHIKHNYSGKGKTLGYTIKEIGAEANEFEFGWTGDSDLTPEACALPPQEKVSPKKVDEAKRWIMDILKTHGEVPSLELVTQAKADGISVATLRRAKSDLSDEIHSVKATDGKWAVTFRSKTSHYWEDKDDPYATP